MLSRPAGSARRKLFDNPIGKRDNSTQTYIRMPMDANGQTATGPMNENVARAQRHPFNLDVLHRARAMGKKIWSLEKLHKVLEMLLEPDPYRSATLGYNSRSGSVAGGSIGVSRGADESALLQQLLHKERISGPSDRDPTVATRELTYFKGPYIYIYDIEEKQKPIMVREYAKVVDKQDGDWPQFRASATGRCPFLEDTDAAAERK